MSAPGKVTPVLALPLDDPIADKLRVAAQSASSPEGTVAAFLALREVFPAELAEDSTFRALVTEALGALERSGAAGAVAALGS